MPADSKTLAMRMLDKAGVVYRVHSYDAQEALSGVEVAKVLGQDLGQVFKTLVTEGKSGQHYVFMLPAAQNLDLKKAAAVCGEKALQMIPQKALLPLTGYVHGGCSPLGMKKLFPTFIDETVILYETLVFSAGKIGLQLELRLEDLQMVIPLELADLSLS